MKLKVNQRRGGAIFDINVCLVFEVLSLHTSCINF